METRTIDTISNKSDYANLCIYVKQLESINLEQLYRALTSYLSVLILPDAGEYLGVYQEHLADSYSWLAKAQCFSQAEMQKEFAKNQAAAAESTLDRALWEDAEKKLNYLIEGWNTDKSSVCQQIVQGISMLINDNIPLPEVHGEIIEFAQGHGVVALEATDGNAVVQRLKHLLNDAWVNSVSVAVKLARTVSVQAELYLNRLTQTENDFTRLDTRQAFLFEANHKLCAFIESQAQGLNENIAYLPTKLSARIAQRLDRIAVSAVLQRYDEYAQPSMSMLHEDNDVSVAHEEETSVDEVAVASTFACKEEVAPVISSGTISMTKLEQLLNSCEQLLETVIKQIALHRLQLSCSSRIKACYGKFVLFPLFRQVATKLTQYQKMLMDSLSELMEANSITEISEEWSQKLRAVKQALENSLARVGTYLNTLNIHHEDYSVTEEIPSWQSKLHDLILYSSEEELAFVDSRLQRIEAMDSPYLRATLVMKLDVAKLKLNDMIFANMQSWSSRLVDRDTVVNTLGYLGIHLHPSHLSKIAPNISIGKRKAVKKKDFYSSAAGYGMTALKNVRAWLNG